MRLLLPAMLLVAAAGAGCAGPIAPSAAPDLGEQVAPSERSVVTHEASSPEFVSAGAAGMSARIKQVRLLDSAPTGLSGTIIEVAVSAQRHGPLNALRIEAWAHEEPIAVAEREGTSGYVIALDTATYDSGALFLIIAPETEPASVQVIPGLAIWTTVFIDTPPDWERRGAPG